MIPVLYSLRPRLSGHRKDHTNAKSAKYLLDEQTIPSIEDVTQLTLPLLSRPCCLHAQHLILGNTSTVLISFLGRCQVDGGNHSRMCLKRAFQKVCIISTESQAFLAQECFKCMCIRDNIGTEFIFLGSIMHHLLNYLAICLAR